MIPPSIPMVVYGVITETSIGKLLIAEYPGILTAVAYSLEWRSGMCGRRRESRSPLFSWRDKFRSLSGIWPMLVLVLVVIGGIYGGIATVTEVAALGAFSA